MLYVIKLILYIILQILFIPFAILGLLFGLLVETHNSKKYGVSFSAGQSLQYRWIMHHFDTREDELSVRFTKAFPCESHIALWGVMGALILAQKWFGFKTRMGILVEEGYERVDATSGIRVLKFDKIIEKYVDQVEQIVLPGAGFDLITLRYTKGKNIKVFEMDQVNTSNLKVQTLKKAGIEHDWVTYIPVNYDTESWVKKLEENGFDKTKKTLFLWQSVSLYLEPDLVKTVLKEMVELCNSESIIAQDLYSLNFLEGKIVKSVTKQMNLIKSQGEPWKFALDLSKEPKKIVNKYLDDCSMEMIDYYSFGEKLDLETFYVIVESKKR